MSKYTRQQRVTKAKILRCRGLSYLKIANELGVNVKTAFTDLNPQAARRAATSAKRWKQLNPERVKEQNRSWAKNNKDRRKTHRQKYQKTLHFRIKNSLRTRLRLALLTKQKTGSAVRDLGCSISEFKIHLENQFQEGMSWENYGEWHIDHIRPLSSFDLSDREQLLVACHYTNLQPLWAADNLSKADKYEYV